MSVTVTDLTDRIVAEVRDGIIDGALNADGVVVPLLNAKLTRDSIWECTADGNVCWSLKCGVAVREFQLAKSNRTVFQIRILEILAPFCEVNEAFSLV